MIFLLQNTTTSFPWPRADWQPEPKCVINESGMVISVGWRTDPPVRLHRSQNTPSLISTHYYREFISHPKLQMLQSKNSNRRGKHSHKFKTKTLRFNIGDLFNYFIQQMYVHKPKKTYMHHNYTNRQTGHVYYLFCCCAFEGSHLPIDANKLLRAFGPRRKIHVRDNGAVLHHSQVVVVGIDEHLR